MCEFARGTVGGVAHVLGNLRRHGARLGAVVVQAQHDQRIAQAGKAEADAALAGRLALLLRQRPGGHLKNVVEHANGHRHRFLERLEIKTRLFLEGVMNKARQVDRAKAAAAVGRQRLFGARVGRLYAFAVVKVVFTVDTVEKEDARLGVIVGRTHDLFPQFARAQLAINPLAVVAPVGAGGEHVLVRTRLVREFDVAVGLHRMHEGVGHAHRNVEVGKIALVLGAYEIFYVRVVAAQYRHLRTAARTG